ncbi:GNAT family N-acetyltransferase [Edaphobacter bradus]|uniref:GNAT family N-acetyltransferase n=1 Tax=Edaphobacter bradus TaxID=2259016 RepID=UPI0021E0476D|nr:GNAT family N-acetyltransferase [Edaphobacter bradus]
MEIGSVESADGYTPGMMRVSLRSAHIEDSDGISRCLGAAFEPYRAQYTVGAFADTVLTPERVRERIATMSVFVAVDESGDVVGTIGCSVVGEGEGHVRGMAVDPRFQGGGIARRLLEAVEAELMDCGCTRVSLDTTAPLKRAVRFYERNGFRASGKVVDFFGMPLFEYVKMLR